MFLHCPQAERPRGGPPLLVFSWHTKIKTDGGATHRVFFFAFELILPGLAAVKEAEYCHKSIAEQTQMK